MSKKDAQLMEIKGGGVEPQEKEIFRYTFSILHKQYEPCYPRGVLTENYSSKAGLGNGSSLTTVR